MEELSPTGKEIRKNKFMIGTGQTFTDNHMSQYIDYLISIIQLQTGASIPTLDGFPMKGCYVPVTLEVTKKDKTILEITIKSLSFEKQVTCFLSRKHSPVQFLFSLQEKIDSAVKEIIKENELNQDEIHRSNHPLHNMNFQDIPNLNLPNNKP